MYAAAAPSKGYSLTRRCDVLMWLGQAGRQEPNKRLIDLADQQPIFSPYCAIGWEARSKANKPENVEIWHWRQQRKHANEQQNRLATPNAKQWTNQNEWEFSTSEHKSKLQVTAAVSILLRWFFTKTRAVRRLRRLLSAVGDDFSKDHQLPVRQCER